MQTFTGFTRETFEFFMKLELNNTKPFFEAHRDEFNECVLEPLKALSTDLAPDMLKLDGQIDARPVMGGTISRIYRDTRYTHDKSPLRTRMWMEFRRRDETHNRVGLFFVINSHSAACGMEVYLHPASYTKAMQQHVMANAARYKRMQKKIANKGFVLDGPRYVRPPFVADDAMIDDIISRKFFWLEKPFALSDTMKPEFKDQLLDHFLSLSPLYKLLRESL